MDFRSAGELNNAFSVGWMQEAACQNSSPDAFFPSDGVGVAEAKRFCRNECDVIADCLEYALAHRIEYGVWGGTSERERRRILKRRKQQESQ